MGDIARNEVPLRHHNGPTHILLPQLPNAFLTIIPPPQAALVDEIARNALPLSQDAFGNYVAQYVLELGHEQARQQVMTQLTGEFNQLYRCVAGGWFG